MTTSTTNRPPARSQRSAPPERRPTEAQATRAFSLSVAASAIRCTLTYIVFPWLLPAIGVASGTGPVIGIPVALVAIGFNLASIRRFWRADHGWKWPISALNVAVVALLVVLIATDVTSLLA